MKSLKAAKADRRARRQDKDRRRRGGIELSLRPSYPGLDAAALAMIEAAIASVDVDGPWERIAPRVLPIIKRFRQPFALIEPVYITVPPGIRTGFGVDVGPAFSHVDAAMVERWGISGATLLGTALENLHVAAIREPPRVERVERDGVPLLTVQGQGWGSSLILAPDLLRPLLGDEPAIVMTPVRNLLVAIPESATLDFLEDLYLTVTDDAPDALDPQLLRWNGSTVVDLMDRSVSLPN